MICPSCGFEMERRARFCDACGGRLFGSSKNRTRQKKQEEPMPEGHIFLSNFCQNMLCNNVFYDTIGSKRRLDNVFTTKPQQ